MEGQKLGQPPTTTSWWRYQIESNLNLMFLSAPRSSETSPASIRLGSCPPSDVCHVFDEGFETNQIGLATLKHHRLHTQFHMC